MPSSCAELTCWFHCLQVSGPYPAPPHARMPSLANVCTHRFQLHARIHARTHAHTPTCTHTHTSTHAGRHACTHAPICTHMHAAATHTRGHASAHTHAHRACIAWPRTHMHGHARANKNDNMLPEFVVSKPRTWSKKSSERPIPSARQRMMLMTTS